MSTITVMQVSDPALAGSLTPNLVLLNTHPTPVIQGVAYVLNADVTAAQALGWTVLSNQPNITDPQLMCVSYEWANENITTFPDGTAITLITPPSQNGTGVTQPTKNVSVPAQWNAWAKTVWGWQANPVPVI